jgi:hypothetical protein
MIRYRLICAFAALVTGSPAAAWDGVAHRPAHMLKSIKATWFDVAEILKHSIIQLGGITNSV